jgi:hypothetical protein
VKHDQLRTYVNELLNAMVPQGERGRSQRLARTILGDLLLTMWGHYPSGNAPSTVGGCVDIAEVTAQADDPDFLFEFDPQLLSGVIWFQLHRTNA